MNISEIHQLRAAGRIDEACAEGRRLLCQFPGDRNARITMAWCLKSLAEQAAKRTDARSLAAALKELATLDLHELGEQSMANRFSWDIRVLLDALKGRPAEQVAAANAILDVLPALHFLRPNKYYSTLADAFAKVKVSQEAQWPRFTEFMDWFGFDNFLPEDYKPIPLKEPGQSLKPLAQRVHTAYYRCLEADIDAGRPDEARIEGFIKRLRSLNDKHPEYEFTLYHLALLLLALGRKQEAIDAIRPFVKRKQSVYWVWSALADAVDDPELRLSCLCRALSCPAQAGYLVKIRFQAAELMHQLGHDANARAEIRLLADAYTRNGWPIPQRVRNMVAQPWYQQAQAPDSNNAFYKAHLAESEQLLFLDSPEVPIIITHVNAEKRIANFITSDQRQGFFSFKSLKRKFVENEVYMVRLDADITDGKISRLLTFRPEQDVTTYVDVFFKKIDGTLRMRPGSDFGFVGDIFIPADAIPYDARSGIRVTGTAVLRYDNKKQRYSWRALRLRPKA